MINLVYNFQVFLLGLNTYIHITPNEYYKTLNKSNALVVDRQGCLDNFTELQQNETIENNESVFSPNY